MTKTSEMRLPRDIDAERAVLVAIMRSGERYADAAGQLAEGHFSLDTHCATFRAMSELHERGEKIDTISLNSALQASRPGLFPGGALSFLLDLETGVPDFPNVDTYIRRLRDRAALRDIQRTAHTLLIRSSEPDAEPAELIEQMRGNAGKLAESLQQSDLATPESIIEAAGGVEAYLDRKAHAPGIPTGYRGLDLMTGGVRPGALYIVAARPAMGKSALAANIVERMSVDQTHTSLIFSLEMSKDEILSRMICSRAKVDSRRFDEGTLHSEEIKRVNRAAGEIAAAGRIHISDKAGTTTDEIHGVIRRHQARYGKVGLVVIDYLQLMLKCKADERVAAMSQISRDAKLIAKDCKVPVLALSQLSRACEARGSDTNVEGYRPLLSDLRESGSIEQDADLVASIFRGEVYLRHKPEAIGMWRGLADLEVLKQRSGPTGIVPLVFLAESVRFEERV